ncbi:ASCH domain-containing protein [Candidatus Neptunochlamydia vexilliferae]|uniref:ASCH domain-containing protein n=1 Tax=Candidatus Neptunichlamydia vexilliferae TaxID=1651774 RepID=UPI001E5D3BA9|nr:ASCH domain-containing protein [Candidatus Neptunochlamydia vexilliferae]
MNVQPQYLNDIINGKKIFEGRLNLPTFKDMQQGDHVIFADNNKRIAICSITSVARYPDFTKMLVSCGVLNMLPQIDPNSNSSIEMVTKGDEIYRSFPGYSEGEKIYGTLAIGIHYISVEAIEK